MSLSIGEGISADKVSFFDEQHGDFSIDLHAIAAWRRMRDTVSEQEEAENGNVDAASDDGLAKPVVAQGSDESSRSCSRGCAIM